MTPGYKRRSLEQGYMQVDHGLIEFDHSVVGLDSSQRFQRSLNTLRDKTPHSQYSHIDTLAFSEGEGELINLVTIPLLVRTSE